MWVLLVLWKNLLPIGIFFFVDNYFLSEDISILVDVLNLFVFLLLCHIFFSILFYFNIISGTSCKSCKKDEIFLNYVVSYNLFTFFKFSVFKTRFSLSSTFIVLCSLLIKNFLLSSEKNILKFKNLVIYLNNS